MRVQTLTAGIVNLVPEGLILLISVTAAVSAFKMARRGVLAQQLNAIESLASVDIVCTDKTGTLTEPTLRVVAVVPAADQDETVGLHDELASYAASAPSRNLTLEAIADARLADVEARRVVGQVPFSSRRRWSALDLDDERLVLGAPELFADADPALAERARERGERRAPGARARAQRIAPTRAPGPSRGSPTTCSRSAWSCSPSGCAPTRRGTVAFFTAQEVDLKVLSGDAPATVGAIAHDAGVPGSAPALDGEALPTDPADAARGGAVGARRRADLARGQARGRGRARRRRALRRRCSATASTTCPR